MVLLLLLAMAAVVLVVLSVVKVRDCLALSPWSSVAVAVAVAGQQARAHLPTVRAFLQSGAVRHPVH
jgi:hypothetical protein